MRSLLLPFQRCYAVFTAVLLIAVILAFELYLSPSVYLAVPLVLFGSLAVLGTADLLQTRHAVLRNYPLSAHIRFLLDPEIRQYFLESEKDGNHFRVTNVRWFISAPSRRSTSVRSARKTASIPAAMSGCTIRSRPGPRSESRSGFLSAAPTAPSPIRLPFSIFRR